MTLRPREPNVRGAGDQLRQQLVRAAAELLLQPRPVALPSLRAVARACGVSPAAVYLHFASSTALIEAVMAEELAALAAYMRAAVADVGDPGDRLHAFGQAYAAWARDQPGAYQLLFETADRLAEPSELSHDNWELIRQTQALVSQATGLVEADAERVTYRLWAALHGVVALRMHKPDIVWPTTLEEDVRAIIAAVAPYSSDVSASGTAAT